MDDDYLWVIAPDVRRISLASMNTPSIQRYFSNHQHLGRHGGLYLIRRPNSRAGPIVVNLATLKLTELFRRPTTFLDAVTRMAASESAEPRRIIREMKAAVGRLVAAEILVRAPSGQEADLRAITPQLTFGDTFRDYRILLNVHCTTDTELYKVEHIPTRETYALKMMRPIGSDPDDRAQYRRMLEHEFQTLGRLKGSAACAIVESGLYRSRPYGVLEWIDGIPLARFAAALRSKGFSIGQTQAALLDLGLRCVEALSSIHEHGYLHGDVHPGNFLVEPTGRVRLVDFGLAQAIPSEATGRRGYVGGVLQFLSPEHASAMAAGRKRISLTVHSEIYAMGAVLYFVFTSDYALDLSPIRDEALGQISRKPIRTFQEVEIEPWQAIEAVLGQALRKEPRDRFSSMADLRSALASCSSIAAIVEPAIRRRSKLEDTNTYFESMISRYLDELRRLSISRLQNSQEPPYASLAFGGAGIGYALLRAAKQLEDPDLLAQAYQWAEHSLAIAAKRTAFAAPRYGLRGRIVHPGSLYYGLAGIHFVRALIAHATDHLPGQRDAVKHFQRLANTTGRAPLELMSGLAGQLLGTAHLRAELGDKELENTGRRLCKALLGTPWSNIHYHGLAHGRGGIYFSLLEWSGVSGSPLPEWFWHNLHRFAAAGEWSGNRVRWSVRPGPATKTYMCSWCNGTPGLLLLWARAYELRGDPLFLQAARGCGRDLLGADRGVAHLCCGIAGQAYALLTLSRLEPGGLWRTHAQRLAVQAMKEERLEHWRNSLFKGRLGLLCLALDLVGHRPMGFPCVEVCA